MENATGGASDGDYQYPSPPKPLSRYQYFNGGSTTEVKQEERDLERQLIAQGPDDSPHASSSHGFSTPSPAQARPTPAIATPAIMTLAVPVPAQAIATQTAAAHSVTAHARSNLPGPAAVTTGGPHVLTALEMAHHVYASKVIKATGEATSQLIQRPAIRMPQQRDNGRALNFETRPNNTQALLAQICGTEVEQGKECSYCRKGSGPWIGCVRVEGYMFGSCANCRYHDQQWRCDYNERRVQKAYEMPQQQPQQALPMPVTCATYGPSMQGSPATYPTLSTNNIHQNNLVHKTAPAADPGVITMPGQSNKIPGLTANPAASSTQGSQHGQANGGQHVLSHDGRRITFIGSQQGIQPQQYGGPGQNTYRSFPAPAQHAGATSQSMSTLPSSASALTSSAAAGSTPSLQQATPNPTPDPYATPTPDQPIGFPFAAAFPSIQALIAPMAARCRDNNGDPAMVTRLNMAAENLAFELIQWELEYGVPPPVAAPVAGGSWSQPNINPASNEEQNDSKHHK